MEIVGPLDNFHIEMSEAKEEDAKVLCNILESDKFDIVERGGRKDGKYYIHATKRR
jgi:hypothetical protein